MPQRAKSIFISYRHEDSRDEVDRLYETLSGHFSADALFRDIVDVTPGADFTQVIRERLRDCDVVLVVIGRDWLNARTDGRERLADPVDPVRLEIQVALGLPFVQVIPVLFRRAEMPRAERLPTSLRRLADISAISVGTRDAAYRKDVGDLVGVVNQAISNAEDRRRRAAEEAKDRGAQLALLAGQAGAEAADRAAVARAVMGGHAVVVCGSELGTDPSLGDPVCREAEIASRVAAQLGLVPPRADEHRPLSGVYRTARENGRRDDFGKALWHAAEADSPAANLRSFLALPPLRVWLTSALDRGMERELEALARPFDSLTFTPEEPLELDQASRQDEAALVFHVAGRARGLLGEAAVDESDWQRFADAWRYRRPDRLASVFEDCDVLFIGGGAPMGFVSFWLELAAAMGCRCLWVGSRCIAEDKAALQYLRDAVHCRKVVFDDVDEAGFFEQLAGQVAQVVQREVAAPSPAVAAPVECDDDGRRTPRPSERPAPFPGLVPYDEGQAAAFVGRERDIERLLGLLRRQRVTVLCAASGMGKSSLIRAGVVPKLQAQHLVPVVARIDWHPDGLTAREQLLAAVADAARAAAIELPPPQQGETLWGYFHDRARVGLLSLGGRSRMVIVLDQFEECFLLAAAAELRERRSSFLTELSDLVEGRVPVQVRAALANDTELIPRLELQAPAAVLLISLREDALLDLLALRAQMPSLGGESVRLLGLDLAGARRVVEAAGAGLFDPEALDALLLLLASERDHGSRLMVEPRIDPSVLQMSCMVLDRMRVERQRERIDAAMVQVAGEHLFDRFIDTCFEGLNPRIRSWVQDELIAPDGQRRFVSMSDAARSLAARGLELEQFQTLVQRRLLRVLETHALVGVELAHDLLARSISRVRVARAPPHEGALVSLVRRWRRKA